MRIKGGGTPDELTGGDEADLITGAGGDDTIRAAGGDDTVYGGPGADFINGGIGGDRLFGGAGDDGINGGEFDADHFDGVAPEGDDTIDGGAGNDRMGGSHGDDLVFGGVGDDTITGGMGIDTLRGGDGADVLYAQGDGGAEQLIGSGADGDRLYGEAGDDILRVDIGGRTGEDSWIDPTLPFDVLRFDGGAGRDVVEVADGLLQIYLDQAAPAGAVDVLEARHVEAIVSNPVWQGVRVFGSDAGGRLRLDDVGGFSGGAGADILSGSGAWAESFGSDGPGGLVDGGAGDDRIVLTGGGSAEGGDGDDYLKIANGTVTYESAAAGVTVALGLKTAQDTGGAGIDTVIARALRGSGHDDALTAATSGSGVWGLSGDDLVTGGAGYDTLDGGEGADTLDGQGAGDLLAGGAGDDWLLGGGGDDVLDGGLGDDTIDGGAGLDAIEFMDASAGVAIDLARTDRQTTVMGHDVYLNIEYLGGSRHADRLLGGASGEEMVALDGDDLLRGRGGSDTLEGQLGNDTLEGGDGDDVLYDTAPQFDGEAGHGVVAGGAGTDRLDWSGYSSVEVTIDLMVATAQEIMDGVTLQISGVENLTTGASNDQLLGTDDANRLDGGQGQNTLNGRGGDDVLIGSSSGSDLNTYLGGDGHDILDFSQGFGPANVDFKAQPSRFAGIEAVIGAGYADTLTAWTGAVVFEGLDGNDSLKGGTGADTLLGGAGGDRLIGGAGADQMRGGAGGDVFVYLTAADSGATLAQADRIRDFDAAAGDRIDLEKIDANTGAAGDQDFHFVAAFTGAAAEAQLSYSSERDTTTLRLDVDGDAVADVMVLLSGEVTADAGWTL